MSNDVAVAIIAGIFTLAAAAASAILGRRAYRASRTAKVETDQAAGSDHSVTAAWESIATTMTQPLMRRIEWLEGREQRRDKEIELVEKRIGLMAEAINKLRSELRVWKRIAKAAFRYAVLLRRQVADLGGEPAQLPDEWELLSALDDDDRRADGEGEGWRPVP